MPPHSGTVSPFVFIHSTERRNAIRYDIIIIGAGPAGSFCAYHLAQAGFHVLIVEKAPFPRLKLCGGAVSFKSARLLDGIIDFKSFPSTSIVGTYLAFKNEHLSYAGHDVLSYSANRTEFDNAILLAARRAGCEVMMPAEVISAEEADSGVSVRMKDGRTCTAGFLVLAEGMNGRLHRQLGYSGRREITMALEIDIEPRYFPEGLNQNALLDIGAIPGGYAWIFPKNGFYNVGAYWYRSPDINADQRGSLARFIDQFDWSKECKKGRLRGYPLPYNTDFRRYNTARTLLVGDTAGTVEDFYGEGFFYGFSSSLIAADVLQRAVRLGTSLNRYTPRLESEVLTQVSFSRFSANLFYAHQWFGYYGMVRNRLLNRIYANLVHGSVSHRQALLYTLLALPVSIFAGKIKDSDFSEVGLLSS